VQQKMAGKGSLASVIGKWHNSLDSVPAFIERSRGAVELSFSMQANDRNNVISQIIHS
jgi:hypothetical protein